MRAILPAIGNDAISVLKGTSLASVIAVNELTLRSQQIVAQNFKFFPVFAAAGIMYLTVTTLISGIQYALERRVSPEVDRRRPRERSALGRLFGFRLGCPPPKPCRPRCPASGSRRRPGAATCRASTSWSWSVPRRRGRARTRAARSSRARACTRRTAIASILQGVDLTVNGARS